MLKFNCQFCSFSCYSPRRYIIHIHLHSHQRKFTCPFSQSCGVICKTVKLLRQHIHRYHIEKEIRGSNSLFSSLRCTVLSCDETLENERSLISHLRRHIDNGLSVSCPVCASIFTNKNSFSSHLSRYHRRTDGNAPLNTSSSVDDPNLIDGESDYNLPIECGDENSEDSIERTGDCSDQVSVESFRKSISLFLLKLQSQCLVPTSTVNQIISEFNHLSYLNNQILVQRIRAILGDDEEKCNLVISLFHKTVLELVLSEHSTNHKRLSIYKSAYSFVEPCEKNIKFLGAPKKFIFSYININETLKTSLSKESVAHQIQNPLPGRQGVIADLVDGSLGQKLNSDKTLLLLLYSDEFEICNPIGSARKKHKLIAFYYVIGNLYPWCRSKSTDIQLIFLAKSEEFKECPEKFLEPLISEIQNLEFYGLQHRETLYKIRLFGVCGDNLGSNFIGGFQCSFSLSSYCCRFCITPPEELPHKYNQFKLRTIENYDDSITRLSNASLVTGIKVNSWFNSLKYFHVCQPGLPPCAAHDILEGIIKVDLPVFIDDLVSKNYFTYETLNKAIRAFKFCPSDAHVKPCLITSNKALTGTACEVWSLIRFLPLILKDFLDEIEDESWECVLSLQRMCLYVFAPELSIEQISHLYYFIEEYLHLRSSAFPNVRLKPKHHLIALYTYLYHTFGPLVHVWTLRFESKHQFFKRVIKRSGNFKNVTTLLAVKHQLLQAFSIETEGCYHEVEYSNYVDLSTNLLGDLQKNAL